MVKRYYAGLITSTKNTTRFGNFVSGIYNKNTHLQATYADALPPYDLRDTYFKYTTLLLNGNPPSPTFVTDASTNSFPISVAGDTKPNSFNPYTPGYYSNYFDGAGDYLSIPHNTLLDLWVGNFTIEMWVYSTGNQSNYTGLITKGGSSVGWTGWQVVVVSNCVNVEVSPGSLFFSNATTLPNNQWVHIAIVKSSTNVSLFQNGTRISAVTGSSTTYSNTADNTLFGTDRQASIFLNGYISNTRTVKGTAVYDPTLTTLTVPTSPLTAIANTSLLTCQSNRFIDNSGNAFTITVIGNTSISSFDPFVPNSNYSTYGSGYFDGTGDNLKATNSTAFDFGSNNFTIECWVYATSSAEQHLVGKRASTAVYSPIILGINTNKIYIIGSNGSSWNINGGFGVGAIPVTGNTWTHLACVRNGTTVTGYVNGVADVIYTSITGALMTNTSDLTIGSGSEAVDNALRGHISNFRIVKGDAVYTGNFTPPAAPLTIAGSTSAASYSSTANVNITFPAANTSLLTCQNLQPTNNSMFLDKSNNSFVITRNGNSTQGTFSPYGSTWSNYFGSSANHLTLPTATASAWGGFNNRITTIEFWAYLTTSATAQGSTGWAIGTAAGVVSDGRWFVTIGGGAASVGAPSKVYWYWTTGSTVGTFVEASQAVPINQWTHIAIVTNATASAGSHTVTIYVDGVGQTFTGLDFSSQTFTYDRLRIGGDNDSFPGWIHGLRIVRAPTNIVGYTGSTITVPTAPVGVVANTLLLTCTTNGFKDLSNVTATIGSSGVPLVQKFNPYTPILDSSVNPKLYEAYAPSINGGSAYFDGTGDYLNIATSPSLSPTSNPFTMECWVYVISNSGSNRGIFALGSTNSAGQALMIYQSGAEQKFGIYNGSSGALSTDTIQLNTWTHLAYVREGTGSNQTKLYVNGKLSATTTFNNTFTSPMPAYIGENAWGELFVGYISDARFINGTAIYTGNFTPPNKTLLPYGTSSTYSNTANINTTFSIANTALLCNFTNAAIYDATMTVNLETVADSRVSTANSKFGGSSMFFDGTGDYLAIPPAPQFAFGKGDFTIECWVYVQTSVANNGIFHLTTSAWPSAVSGVALSVNGASGWGIYYNGTSANGGTQPSLNTWYHTALVRSGTSLKLYVNGVATITVSDSASYTGTYLTIGGYYSTAYLMAGYIDDFRITRYARYTANFTPPTESFRLK